MATLASVFDDTDYESFDSVFGGFLDDVELEFAQDSNIVINTSKGVTTAIVDNGGYKSVFTNTKALYKLKADEEAVVLTGANNSKANGNNADNLMVGNDGNNALLAGNGNDTVKGGLGDDVLNGGAGNDVLLGEEGDDKLLGTNGNDTLNGGQGDDSLDGGNDDDYLDGAAGSDQLAGGGGNDELVGGGGNDKLNGGTGNDTLNGGDANDLLVGGAGSDSFVIGNDSGHDIILDFGVKLTGKLSTQFEDKLYIMDQLGGGAAHTGDDDTFDAEDFTISMAADDSGVIIAFADGGTVLLKGLDEEDAADLNLQEDESGVYFTLA